MLKKIEKIILFAVFIFVGFLVYHFFIANNSIKKRVASIPQNRCSKIITTAPSLTETVASLGLLKNLKAVSNYCNYPSAVKSLPKIGGVLNPNFEMIMKINPTVVFVMKQNKALQKRLKEAKINFFAVKQGNINEILYSFSQIARYCNVINQGVNLENQVRNQLANQMLLSKNKTKQRVMIVVGRNYESKTPKGVYIAGIDGFYTGLLKVVGAKNVFTSSNLAYPQVSTEGIISLNPDIIIEIVHPNTLKKHSKEELKTSWLRLKEINAVKNHRIYIYSKPYATIPGPRIGKIAEDFFSFIHQEN